ncbi:MAG: DNA polymerase III subunit gamma/tau [Clostridia bacterium]|nr:DNA polymerase III subunit gamma/tau [Clostridia bacterium]
MYQALYRKYRPAVFADVCGQEHITSVLKYQAENGRVSHAYLFCGSRGTGKTTCAKILAKAVNCENPVGGDPCGKCPSCRAIDSGNATDVLEMDAASNNGVDYIRDIRDEVAYTPAMLKKRVYIVDEVHMLSASAFNALLKTLEEPPEHVVFILATTELHKLPTTIVSRCQRFDFRRISIPVLSERITHIADVEKIRLDPDAAQQIARQAQGGMRDAINLFELCSGGGADVTLDRVHAVLGLSGYDSLYNTALYLAEGNMKKLLAAIADVAASSKDITVFWQELTAFFRDMMVHKYADDPREYLDLTESEANLLKDAADRFNIKTLTYQSAILDQSAQAMQRTPQMKRTIAEFALMRMCDPALDTSAEALNARIGQLEDRLALMEIGSAVPAASRPPVPDESAPKEITPPVAEAPVSAPDPTRTDMEFDPVEDVSEFLEKLGTIDKRAESFLSDARISVSADGKSVSILADNEFSAQMLSADSVKVSISRALTLCRIANPDAQITVTTVKTPTAADPAAEDLYSKI